VNEGDEYARSYVQDLQEPEGLPQYITEEGYVAVLLSPDMKKLVVRHPNDEKYYFHEYPVRSDGPDPVLIPGLQGGDEPIQWNKDASALYVRGPEVRGRENLYADILLVDLRSGERTSRQKIEPPDPIGNIGLSGRVVITPDGNSYAATFWNVLNRLTLGKGLKF
jgi:hypothetical protein